MKSSDDFFTIEQRNERLYEEGRRLFLQGKHEEALDRFKRIYEDTVVFRDVAEIVDDYYAKPKDEWLSKYQPRFERQDNVMKPQRARSKMLGGMIFIIAGLLIAVNCLVSGPHAFGGGVSAVVSLCLAGLLLVGAGAKLIYDATHAT